MLCKGKLTTDVCEAYHIQSNFGNDHSVPRSRNLFWRIWSNPNLRAVSNEEFNELWQRCRHQTALRPYRPDPGLWERWVGRRPQKIQVSVMFSVDG